MQLTSMIQGAGESVTDRVVLVFGSGSWLAGGGAARYARGGTGSDRAGAASFPGRGDGGGWSGGCGQGAQPPPAGQEGVFPGPGPADLQHPGAGVADQPGGQAQQPVAQRVRLGVLEILLVVEAEQAAPGGQVGGEAGGQHPAAVHRPGFGCYLEPSSLRP